MKFYYFLEGLSSPMAALEKAGYMEIHLYQDNFFEIDKNNLREDILKISHDGRNALSSIEKEFGGVLINGEDK